MVQHGRYIELNNHKVELCIRPDLVIDAAYHLIYHQDVQQNHGFVTGRKIKQVLKHIDQALAKKAAGNYHQELAQNYTLIMEFMATQGVALQTDEGYFFPDAATKNEPEDLKCMLKSNVVLYLCYELDFMPLGLRAKLLSHMIGDKAAKDCSYVMEDVWRDGFIMRHTSVSQASDGCVVVEYQHRYHRIVLRLVGDGAKTGHLLKLFDHELSRFAGRDLVKQPIFKAEQCQFIGERASDEHKAHCKALLKSILVVDDQVTITYGDMFNSGTIVI